MNSNEYTRRQTLQLLGAGAAAWIAGGVARASELPIKTSGLEHAPRTPRSNLLLSMLD